MNNISVSFRHFEPFCKKKLRFLIQFFFRKYLLTCSGTNFWGFHFANDEV